MRSFKRLTVKLDGSKFRACVRIFGAALVRCLPDGLRRCFKNRKSTHEFITGYFVIGCLKKRKSFHEFVAELSNKTKIRFSSEYH